MRRLRLAVVVLSLNAVGCAAYQRLMGPVLPGEGSLTPREAEMRWAVEQESRQPDAARPAPADPGPGSP